MAQIALFDKLSLRGDSTQRQFSRATESQNQGVSSYTIPQATDFMA
jgi:hypothetical protein